MTATHSEPTVVIRADHVPGPPQGCWTYDDYAALPDDGHRYEIINGVLYMSPAPSTEHQNAVSWFTAILKIHIQGGGFGFVFSSPIDVQLQPQLDPVQPDVVVILRANRAIITSRLIAGAPDLVIEVASPSTANHDRREKLDAYAAAGVREYWIAEPYAHTIELLVVEQGRYRSLGLFAGQDKLPSWVVPNLAVSVEDFFAME